MLADFKNEKENLPDFLIVGAAKSGTTSIYYYLQKHPQIFMSPIKEPWFFSFIDNPPKYESPAVLQNLVYRPEEYFKLFRKAKKHQIIGEASPSYLYTHKTTVTNIKKIYGPKQKNLKIIIILRNPLERAFSQYLMFKRDKFEELEFLEAVSNETIEKRINNKWNIFYDYVGFGMYYEQVKTFLEQFSNIKICLFDDVVADKDAVVSDICDFLEVGQLKKIENTKYNKSGLPKIKFVHNFLTKPVPSHLNPFKKLLSKRTRMKIKYKIFEINLSKPKISSSEREYLISVFKDDIKKLEKLINRNLLVWLSLQ